MMPSPTEAPTESRTPLLSIVVPVYNEQEVLPELHRRLTEVLKPWEASGLEILLVNDGSTRTTTLPTLQEMQARDPRVRILDLSRNFGHQMALTAGIDHAAGRAVICMDSDLQHPPEMIPEMVRLWEEGFDVVYTRKRRAKGSSMLKTIFSEVFYRLVNFVSATPIDYGAADFRLMDRRVVEILCRCRERHRFLRGMVAWAGFRQTAIDYDVADRFADTPKYTFKGLVKLATDGVFSFSFAPLRAGIYLGFAVCLLTCFYSLYVLGTWMLNILGVDIIIPRGFTSQMLVLSFLGGVQITMMGLLGEYVGRIYDEVKRRPLYIVCRTDPAPEPDDSP